MTMNGWATWTGKFTEVPITVNGGLAGSAYGTTLSSGSTTVLDQSYLRYIDNACFAVATIVEREASATTSADMGTGSPELTESAGPNSAPAPCVSFPTGVMVAGGIAGALVGAWGF
jgi:hypothetical protein